MEEQFLGHLLRLQRGSNLAHNDSITGAVQCICNSIGYWHASAYQSQHNHVLHIEASRQLICVVLLLLARDGSLLSVYLLQECRQRAL